MMHEGRLREGGEGAGKYVDLKDTISGFKGILEGQYDDLPEMAFYMVSTGLRHRTRGRPLILEYRCP